LDVSGSIGVRIGETIGGGDLEIGRCGRLLRKRDWLEWKGDFAGNKGWEGVETEGWKVWRLDAGVRSEDELNGRMELTWMGGRR
jgi:hypothetical protein